MFGFIYVVIEYGLLNKTNIYPSTGNPYSIKNSFIITCSGSLLMGIIIGSIEVLWLKKFLSKKTLWRKILFKSIFYIVVIITFLILIALFYNASIHNTSIFDALVIDSVIQFFKSFAFWSVIIYIGFILDISLYYSEIDDYSGSKVLFNYLGRYHKPIQETRIFMFLDMKSSTSIAENIGHEKYFKLLKAFYADMTHAILETNGEVYQYVGDEIVVTWDEKNGIKNSNCIKCFYKIFEAINNNRQSYIDTFGFVPNFKAGCHIGEVTTGEIGIIKKEIIYTGDPLNTTARIQAECNNLNAKLLISEELKDNLPDDDKIIFTKVDCLMLRGKKEPMQLYSVLLN